MINPSTGLNVPVAGFGSNSRVDERLVLPPEQSCRGDARPRLFAQPVDQLPRRGDDVARWLQAHRDRYPDTSEEYDAVDTVLTDYQRRADAGERLVADH